jgi:iron complex transport system substrate-binding protein
VTPRPRLLGATALAVALLLGGAACSAPVEPASGPTPTVSDQRPLGELDLLADPRTHVGPSTAVLGDAVVEPVVADPVPELPVEVVSHDAGGDRDVVVGDASRVLGLDLAGSIAGTIWGLGLGDRLVGRDASTTFAGTAGLPLVTSNGHVINSEAILALRPTLVLTDGSIGPRDVLEQLREAGVTVVFVDNEASFEGAAELARQVAGALGVPEAGELLADRILTEVERTRGEIAAIAPDEPERRVRMMFLYLRGGSGIFYLFGSESGADVLIEALGGIDVAGEIGWAGMRPLTDEAVIAADPDLILVMTDGLASAGGVEGLLEARPALALTTAGKNRRLVDMADGDVLSFGPRSAAILDALARAIYAPAR